MEKNNVIKEGNTIKEIVQTALAVSGKAVTKGAVKTLLNTCFPWVSPAIDAAVEIATNLPDQLKQKRREIYLENILQRILYIEEQYIDMDYLLSNDFIELVAQIEEAVTRTKSTDRIEFFSTLFVTTLSKNRSTIAVDWQISFIRIISDLNEAELISLKELENCKNGFSVTSYKEKDSDLSKEDFLISIDSLFTKGLITDVSLEEIKPKLTGGITTAKSLEIVKLSSMAKKLIEYIHNTAESLSKINNNEK